MQAKREYRDRDETEVAVLDALVDRSEEGMTVFELRSGVGVAIDEIEPALANLKDAGLIRVENEKNPLRIYPADHVVPETTDREENSRSLFERIREKLPF